MAFRLNLTAEQRQRIDAELRFACECHAAGDLELGQHILALGVRIRTDHPEQFKWTSRGDGYSGALVWEVIPEIARRLGVTDFGRGQRPYELKNDSPLELRIMTGHAIFGARSCIFLADGSRVDPPAWSRIQHEPCNGNALAIGLDRVAPPTDDPYDILARRIAEVSVARGLPPQQAWTPSMQDYARGARFSADDGPSAGFSV